jgi:hypothetical protein
MPERIRTSDPLEAVPSGGEPAGIADGECIPLMK